MDLILSMEAVSRTASGEIRQNNGGSERWRGIANICSAMDYERLGSNMFAAPVLANLRRISQCGKEAFLLT